MKKLAVIGVALGLVFGLAGCGETGVTEAPSSGLGVTYGGKTGFDLGGGVVLPYDGSGIGLGFGF